MHWAGQIQDPIEIGDTITDLRFLPQIPPKSHINLFPPSQSYILDVSRDAIFSKYLCRFPEGLNLVKSNGRSRKWISGMRFGQLLPRAAVEAAKKPPKSPLSTLKPASGHPSDSNCHVNRLPQGLKQGGVTPGRQERLVRRLRQCQIGHFLICAQNHQYER